MMARRTILAGLAGGMAALLAGCGLLGGNKYRFRMTVEVETPQGLRSGSSVYEVSAWNEVGMDPSGRIRRMTLKGEAIVLDLPAGPVFVLLRTSGANPDIDLADASMATLDQEYRNDWVESAGRISGSWSTRRGEVPRADWPLMVRFRDIKDPTSVEPVDPDTIGVKRIVLETTSDEVTTGIEKRLDVSFWRRWGEIHRQGMSQEGGVMNNPYFTSLAGTLSRRDFTTQKLQ